MTGEQPAKRRKPNKRNKFRQHAAEAGAAPAEQPAAQKLHDTAGAAATKKKRKKRRAQRHEQGQGGADNTVAEQPDAPAAAPPQRRQQQAAPPPRFAAAPPSGGAKKKDKKGKGGSLLEQMRARLSGGRFRWLNEALYTSGGAEALAMVQAQPELMDQYHEGFREQTRGWPVQPVDQAIRWLRGRPPTWVVADLGCGDAKIAASVEQKVHSFDLAETAPGVVACNMAALPLPPASVDAAVFCLSLMGTDYGSFLREAARVLRPAGWLWIAEVQSRFMSEGGGGGGGGEPGGGGGADGSGGRSVLPAFLAALRALGFELRRKDTSNTHFLVLELQRQAGGGGGKQRAPQWPPLRACQYKKR